MEVNKIIFSGPHNIENCFISWLTVCNYFASFQLTTVDGVFCHLGELTLQVQSKSNPTEVLVIQTLKKRSSSPSLYI